MDGPAKMDRDEFLTAALRNPANAIIAGELHDLALPDAWLVAGCLAQTVWNVATGRAVEFGINDYDVFYYDPDTSWAAEDAVIRDLRHRLAVLDVTIEARNRGSRSSHSSRIQSLVARQSTAAISSLCITCAP